MNGSKRGIEPFYFGPSTRPLFGLYHAPRGELARDTRVVLCHPIGHEFIRFHRAQRQLATRLSNAGFSVLRFDFYGCGDSAGDSDEGHVNRWIGDVSAAIDEMKRRSAARTISLVGFRLAGTLSLMAAAMRGDVDSLVLWDPVVSGKAYVHQSGALHREMLRSAHVNPDHPGSSEAEALGFPLTERMRADLDALDLLTLRPRAANTILLVESKPQGDQRLLRDRLERTGAAVEYRHLPDPQFWVWGEDFTRVLVPHQILQSIVTWISRVHP